METSFRHADFEVGQECYVRPALSLLECTLRCPSCLATGACCPVLLMVFTSKAAFLAPCSLNPLPRSGTWVLSDDADKGVFNPEAGTGSQTQCFMSLSQDSSLWAVWPSFTSCDGLSPQDRVWLIHPHPGTQNGPASEQVLS